MTEYLTPNSNNLDLGAGEVWFDRFDANGKVTGMRHLGNVDTFELTFAVDKKEKKNAMDGAKATYAEVNVGSSAEVSMVLSEYTKENLALAMLGTSGYFTQAADAAVVDRPVGPDVAANVQLDTLLDLGCFNPTVTAVKQGVTTLAPDAYVVDAEAGTIKLLSSYTGVDAAVAGTLVTWSGSIPAIVAGDKKWKVQALATGIIKGRLRYKSAANQVAGPRKVVDVWIVGLAPDGAMGLITEDFGTFTLKGKVYADTTKAVGEQYCRTIAL